MPSEVSTAGADQDRRARELERELAEAWEQRAATAEILRAMSTSSPADPQRVFAMVAANAARLCDAYDALVLHTDGDVLRLVAHEGRLPTTGPVGHADLPLTRGAVMARAVLDRRTIQVADMLAEGDEYPEGSDLARRLGHRTILAVPLIRAGKAIGVIALRRTEVRPFIDRQIALLQTFADQAVIAIENTRLFEAEQVSKRELQESLGYQTAISDVLSVISRSPTNLQPVFDTIAQAAAQLCKAQFCHVCRFDGKLIHFAAAHGLAPEGRQALQSGYPLAPGRTTATARSILSGSVEEIPDVHTDPDYAHGGAATVMNLCSVVAVPMLKDNHPIGAIAVARSATGRFPTRQIDLLKTFAEQAVIAIENARLFEAEQVSKRELQESLEYQTATSDVLQVISSSPGQLQPVYETMLAKALRHCDAKFGGLFRYENGVFRGVAGIGIPEGLLIGVEEGAARLTPNSDLRSLVASRQPMHSADLRQNASYLSGDRFIVGAVERGGARAALLVPLMKEESLIGALAIYRQEVRPFTDKQVKLVQTFADQAVIAIENTRLFEELQARTAELTESLEYQTAISEVLGVISRSPSQVQPVLDIIVATARRLCEADRATIMRLQDGKYRFAARDGRLALEFEKLLADHPIAPGDKGTIAGRVALAKRTIHIEDIRQDPEYTAFIGFPDDPRRALLGVPLLRDEDVIGVIVLSRFEARPFSRRQIDLVTTFADQAVIAIENARLFDEVQARTRELTESLEYQTATSEVLGVISQSPAKIQPVLDTIAETAQRLCQSADAYIFKLDEGRYHLVAANDARPERVEYLKNNPIVPDRGSVVGRVALEGRSIQVADVRADSEYTLSAVGSEGYRTTLGVPLLRDGISIGVIILTRYQVQPFSEKQVELVTTFADQAVIAIENTRLFEEVQARTRELTEALRYQTATSDVLNVISRSTTNAQPVFDAIVKSAAQLFDPCSATITSLEDGQLHYRATASARQSDLETVSLKAVYPIPFDPERSPSSRAILEQRIVEILDAVGPDTPEFTQKAQQALGFRSATFVPLIRDGNGIGAVALAHPEPGFKLSGAQLALVQTFADQAVIAIENARLFEEVQARTRELQESLEHQTATADVLKVISRSAFDLQAVLDTLVQSAATLCEADMANIWRPLDGAYRLAASYGVASQHQDWLAMKDYLGKVAYGPGRGSIVGRTLLERATVQIEDIRADSEYDQGAVLAIEGLSTFLGVPLLREGNPVGVMVLVRSAVRPFSVKQIELVETFADQAVIAIENARLFEEVQARTRQLETALERQTASAEILGVISSSPGTLEPVFDAILSRARALCGAKFGHLILFDGEVWQAGALHNVPRAYAEFWERAQVAGGLHGTLLERLVETGRPYQAEDARLGPAYRARTAIAVATVELAGARTLLGVPLLKDGKVIGAIMLFRTEVRPFDDQQIALVSSFAAQAVIAIENARLLADLQERQRELARSVDELKSLGEVNRAVNASLDLDKVLPTILEHACAMAYASGGTIYEFDKATGEFHLTAGHNMSEEHIARVRAQPIRLGDPGVGQCGERREAVQIADIDTAEPSPMLDILRRTGVRAILSVPLLHRGEVIGALGVRRNRPGAFSPEIIRLLESFAAQSAVAVHNARLFKEVEEKGRQLALANQHKSQFVANMSHELRTPLAAILGYAELLKEGIYGGLPEKSTPIVGRIQSNGTHLLGLINTVLDLSKIEAGQFTLNLSEYALDSMVETVRVATESLAETKKLALKTDVAKSLPIGLGDEQRLTQVLLNLVGNAIKFTDTGEVRIAAAARGGRFAIAVTDTGPGIPAEEQHKIFEEFHQVDNSNTKKKGGTGLGLAIAKQIVEMHGGRIWVESSPGKGSTFRMEFPVRAPSATDGAA